MIPSFIFSMIILPGFILSVNQSGINPLYYLKNIYFSFPNGEITFGHTWYLVDLFVFICIFIVINNAGYKKSEEVKPVTFIDVVLLCMLLCFGAFISRCFFSPGYWLPLHVLEPARILQYFGFFIIGTRKEQFGKIAQKRYIYRMAVIISLLLIFAGPGIIVFVLRNKDMWASGYTWKSLIVSSWECCLSICISFVLLAGAKKYFNKSSKTTKILGNASFGVYLIHPFVLVLLQAGVNSLNLPIVYKFLLSSILSISLSYILIIIIKGIIAKCSGQIVTG